MEIEIGHKLRILNIRGNGFWGDLDPKAPAAIESKFPFWGAQVGDNGLRAPPVFDYNRNVLSDVPPISLPSMVRNNNKTLCPNPPIPRRKSEATAHMDDDTAPHHYEGGQIPNARSLKVDLVSKREMGS